MNQQLDHVENILRQNIDAMKHAYTMACLRRTTNPMFGQIVLKVIAEAPYSDGFFADSNSTIGPIVCSPQTDKEAFEIIKVIVPDMEDKVVSAAEMDYMRCQILGIRSNDQRPVAKDLLEAIVAFNGVADGKTTQTLLRALIDVLDATPEDIAQAIAMAGENVDQDRDRPDDELEMCPEDQQLAAVFVKWEESEAGWGQRPDGFSLHVSLKVANAYIDDHWSKLPDGHVPNEYSRPTNERIPVLVSPSVMDMICKNYGSLRVFHNTDLARNILPCVFNAYGEPIRRPASSGG